MMYFSTPGVTLAPLKKCLLATVHASLEEQIFGHIRQAVLERVAHNEFTAVVFDLSSVHLLDAYEFGQMQQLARMLRLMGVRTMVVGLSVGLVAYLAGADVDTEGIEAERGLQEALERLMPQSFGAGAEHG